MHHQVDVDSIRAIKAQLAQVNATPLSELEIYDSGERVVLTPDQIDSILYFGMNNIDVIHHRLWSTPEYSGPDGPVSATLSLPAPVESES